MPTTAPEQTLSLWDLTLQGGVIMIPLAVMLLVSIYILVDAHQ